ncbi:hybrid sensor histidine kinase/response regulator [Paraburkholderia ginsengiterrae]|uniref:Virulence sensor protein BvgS n=1 Tax=Paraburkholderia ginsengiterrae TaxID=1462993 RepID=A0A1A9NHX3_9BURK|nr:ATP-binding protein [Paraburkholderia ginsengiterrae]OAJ53889.1 hybrid sensor histidine kinase/response regulator [Paraburkholderia ginsengiterrae]OAJ65744.1 hybrid sensor histidine kinase/response regulator [Paraburkholderia ginsengiterrae]
MQKILDSTQESLAQAFASLAHNAKRQRRVYLATIGVLMLIVLIVAVILVIADGLKLLDYRRTLDSQNAAEISLLLHREESFLRRVQFTLDYFDRAPQVSQAPDAVQQAIRQSGAARGKTDKADGDFDILVDQATRAAWGPRLGEKLGRLYEAAQSTLATQQAFELQQRATLIGLQEGYAVFLPSLTQPVADKAAGPGPSPTSPERLERVRALRATLERQIEAQTGKKLPAKGERIWLGPYLDPVDHVQMISAVSAYFEGNTPTTLISVDIPLDGLAARIAPPDTQGVILLMSADRRIVVSSKPISALTGKMLQQAVATTPSHLFHYGLAGSTFHEPMKPDFGYIVGFTPWAALAVALGWQLAVIAGFTALILLAIALMARYFGLQLLRKTFEEASRALESETLNHILVSATPVGLCIVRQSDYSILTANALAAELLRIEPGSKRLPPHVVSEFLAQTPDRPSATAFARIAAFVVAAEPLQVQQTMQPTSPVSDEGGPPARFLQLTYAPARYAGENVLFCAILDVTAQTLLEQELRRAQQASDAMMRARTNFFAAMSHEIRTPLNALLGNLELFARTPGLEMHLQRLSALSAASDTLRRVVNDVLDFSKIDAGAMMLVNQPMRLIDDFENIALTYAPMRGDRAIRFYALISPTLDQTLIGDRIRIAQIVNNLLSNAFKFTSSGKITLHAEVIEDSPGRAILTCRVSDSGAGMSEETLARLFKPFAQGELGTSRGASSTGLGLVICARLCELMGGKIFAESVPGVGSAFNVSIPLAKPSADVSTPTAPPGQRGNVLVLSYQREAAELMDQWLQRAGWAGHLVDSLAAAQASLRANRPDVLIVSGEFDLDAIATLRDSQPVGTVWITRAGPLQAEARGEGVLEVSEFNRTAVMAAIELVAEGTAPAPAPTVAQPAVLYPELLGLTVLVAEDNPLIQSLIDEQLTELGCVPTITHDGKQALTSFNQARFEVVLTDIHMPEMNGYELLAALREERAEVPVLAFSAASENDEAHGWRELGFSGSVTKPASLGELQAALLAVVPTLTRAEPGKLASAQAAASSAPVASVGTATTPLHEDDKARYTAMLKEHLQKDLPRLLAIVDAEDKQALAGWAHSASGAFVVMQEPQFVNECRQLQRLCRDNEHWTTEMDERAVSLHEALSDHYGLDEQSAH